jgi:hypothetical protein
MRKRLRSISIFQLVTKSKFLGNRVRMTLRHRLLGEGSCENRRPPFDEAQDERLSA